MTWTPISGAPLQYSTANNDLAGDYWLKFYNTGTITPFSMAIDSLATQTLAKCKLNPSGYPITDPLDNTTVFIPHIDRDYRIVLYTSEADADANNTTAAAFNINGNIQQIPALADSTDISIKGVTLQALDDYDRSPLFVDVEDFTAGAGPHVINVPAAWTPTNTDVRFWKKDNSGIITVLSPTVKTGTTFTLADTLLSTDVVFIGDDDFRNQMDGDPVDITTRAGALRADNNLSDLENVTTARANLGLTGVTNIYENTTGVQGYDITGLPAALYIIETASASGLARSSRTSYMIWWSGVSDVGSQGTNANSGGGGTNTRIINTGVGTDKIEQQIIDATGTVIGLGWINRVDRLNSTT